VATPRSRRIRSRSTYFRNSEAATDLADENVRDFAVSRDRFNGRSQGSPTTSESRPHASKCTRADADARRREHPSASVAAGRVTDADNSHPFARERGGNLRWRGPRGDAHRSVHAKCAVILGSGPATERHDADVRRQRPLRRVRQISRRARRAGRIPPVASGANPMMSSRFHVPPRGVGNQFI